MPVPHAIHCTMKLAFSTNAYLNYSFPETARRLDIPEGTVKSRTSRALAKLRTHINKVEWKVGDE